MTNSLKEELEKILTSIHLIKTDSGTKVGNEAVIIQIISLLEESVGEWLPKGKNELPENATPTDYAELNGYYSALFLTEKNFRNWLSAGDTNVIHKEKK